MTDKVSIDRAERQLGKVLGTERVGRIADGDGLWVRPEEPMQVSDLVRVAAVEQLRVAVDPQDRAHLWVDLSRMDQVLSLDETSLLVHAQAGVSLDAIERRLDAHGVTLGALPPSSWARRMGAALAAPRPSEAGPRGRLIDRCVSVEAVLADGTLVGTRRAPRKATGPELANAFLGARGATGILTSAWLRCSRRSPGQVLVGALFATKKREAALAVARSVLRCGADPSDLAIVDGRLGVLEGLERTKTLLAARFEGAAEWLDATRATFGELAKAAGGHAAPLELVDRWFHRKAERALRERLVSHTGLRAAWSGEHQGAVLAAFQPAGAVLMTADERTIAPTPGSASLGRALAAALDPDGRFARAEAR